MTGSRVINVSVLCTVALAACGSANDQRGNKFAADAKGVEVAGPQPRRATAGAAPPNVKSLPEKYIRAFTCNFDKNPIAAWEEYHKTAAGRDKRTADLRLLRSVGFNKEGRDGDLESLGGKVTAPAGLTLLGLPVRSLELNGMIGDANSMYVATFAKDVAVSQVVRAARLEMDRKSYDKYKIRHYSRRIGDEPDTELYLDDRSSGDAVLVCRVQSTPD